MRRKLTHDMVTEIRTSPMTCSDLGRKLGVATGTVYACRVGIRYQEHPVPPKPKGYPYRMRRSLKLKPDMIAEIRASTLSAVKLAPIYGVTAKTVCNARNGTHSYEAT